MANQKNVLNGIRTLLGMESELELLAEAILEDGTKIATDSEEFAEGSMAYVVSEDGEKMPLPSGSYATQDGVSMEVVDGEVISISKEEVVEEAKSERKRIFKFLNKAKSQNAIVQLTGLMRNFSNSGDLYLELDTYKIIETLE